MSIKQPPELAAVPARDDASLADAGPAPRVSVVICAYTMARLPFIRQAVASVLHQTLPPHEVVVAVDHNSELFARLRADLDGRVTLVHNDGPERGAVVTDNLGVRYCTGDIVAFMDDDAAAESDWLERLAGHFRDPGVAAAGGKLVPEWQEGRPSWFAPELDWIVGGTYRGHPHRRTGVRNLILCNMAVRRGVFRSTGGFTTELGRRGDWGTGAESEFFLRLKRRFPHAAIRYEPEAVVHHKVPAHRGTPRYVLQRSYNEGFHKALIGKAFAGQSRDPLSVERSYLWFLARSVWGRLLRFYRRGNLGQVLAIAASVTATGAGYLAGIYAAARGRVQLGAR